MISYLKGTLSSIDDKSFVVNVQGVGYLVYATSSLLMEAKEGGKLEVYTYLDFSSREETLSLFGFGTREELKFFQQLIKISGVGPRSALAVLSVARISELKGAIASGDYTLLQKVSGIGKKTAERIVMELRDKLGFEDVEVGDGATSDRDVYEALAGLGYSSADVRTALRNISPDAQTVEERVKEVLRVLGGN